MTFYSTDKKSLFGRYGHTPGKTVLKERLHGIEGARTGLRTQAFGLAVDP